MHKDTFKLRFLAIIVYQFLQNDGYFQTECSRNIWANFDIPCNKKICSEREKVTVKCTIIQISFEHYPVKSFVEISECSKKAVTIARLNSNYNDRFKIL